MDEFYRLYRECFPEDSDRCADVIMKKLSCADRRALYDGGRLRSALYLVEKKVFYCGKTITVPHIVGLGTFIEDRKKGYAAELLKRTLNSLDYPFVTLYPFSHAFYEKYGFSAVSFDFDEPADKGIPVSSDRAREKYLRFCDGLDFYVLREEEDYRFFDEVYRADGEGFYEADEGVGCPDGFIPKAFRKTQKKGVMARIVDLEKAMRLTGVSCDRPVSVKDGVIEKNNRSFSLDGGKPVFCESGEETDVSVLTSAVFGDGTKAGGRFPGINGYLADKY
ncbi:MAG: GNAT family N-acetyltransferase [Christensenellales bacterium]